MRRASYRYGVKWIADNDDPMITDEWEVALLISTALLADLFGVHPDKVARDVVRERKKNQNGPNGSARSGTHGK